MDASSRIGGSSSEPTTGSDQNTMAESVVAKIVAIAADAAAGVRPPTHVVQLHCGEREVVVNLELTVEHGVRIPDLVQTVRDDVRDAVRRMTDLEVVAVHVVVGDLHVPGTSTGPEPGNAIPQG